MDAAASVATFLFTDIEGSSRLWEREPERMGVALARHDAIVRGAVERHRGTVVKMLGDGVDAHFRDPLDALEAIVAIQLALVDPASTGGLPLRVRSGLHAGMVTARDHDYFGSAVNRAARIMSAAHGGQILVSRAVLDLVAGRPLPDIELLDLGAVRLRDLTSPEHLYQIVHAKLRREFPALRSLEATPNNLPQQVTSFVGRERELAEVKRALATTRLLTLIGAGGIGKTRIALHVAAEVMDDYADGVWFVDLAPVTDAQVVSPALANVLGVAEDAGRVVGEAIVRHLTDRRALIILDNCEHLLNACAELATQILRGTPNVRLLATSREPLHVAGETSVPVPALSVPDAARRPSPDALSHFESARLFVERAHAVKPSFAVTEENVGAIADICRRLDGIPLAIELAAARVRALAVEAIATRLSDRFRLLTGSDQTVLPRQQTLRALIDWSYDLLSDPEKALFRRLSVFSGGWTLEAAEAITVGDLVDPSDVLDLQGRLVDRSLVAMDANGDRYRMLETVREYAKDKLERGDRSATRHAAELPGEGVEVHDRHLRYYLGLAERAQSEAIGDARPSTPALFDRERENLLAAHAWCDRAATGGEFGLRLTRAMGDYFFAHGMLALGRRLAHEALDRPGAGKRSVLRALGLFQAGQLECFMGRYADGQRLLGESLDMAKELDDRHHVGKVLQPLAMAAFGLGDLSGARRYLLQACDLARELGDKRELAGALNGLAQIHRLDGDVAAAEPLYADVVGLAREVGDREILAVGLLNLAMVAIDKRAEIPAGSFLAEAVALVVDTGSKLIGQSALDVAAARCAAEGRFAQAARLYCAAEALIAECGFTRDPADAAFLHPFIERAREALGAPGFEDACKAGRTLPFGQALEEARTSCPDPSLAAGPAQRRDG